MKRSPTRVSKSGASAPVPEKTDVDPEAGGTFEIVSLPGFTRAQERLVQRIRRWEKRSEATPLN